MWCKALVYSIGGLLVLVETPYLSWSVLIFRYKISILLVDNVLCLFMLFPCCLSTICPSPTFLLLFLSYLLLLQQKPLDHYVVLDDWKNTQFQKANQTFSQKEQNTILQLQHNETKNTLLQLQHTIANNITT